MKSPEVTLMRLVAAALGIVLGATAPCRSSTAVAGAFLALMGGLFAASARGGLNGGTPMVRAREGAWRRVGPSLLAFGAGLTVAAAVGYLVAGPGSCG